MLVRTRVEVFLGVSMILRYFCTPVSCSASSRQHACKHGAGIGEAERCIAKLSRTAFWPEMSTSAGAPVRHQRRPLLPAVVAAHVLVVTSRAARCHQEQDLQTGARRVAPPDNVSVARLPELAGVDLRARETGAPHAAASPSTGAELGLHCERFGAWLGRALSMVPRGRPGARTDDCIELASEVGARSVANEHSRRRHSCRHPCLL